MVCVYIHFNENSAAQFATRLQTIERVPGYPFKIWMHTRAPFLKKN